MATIVNSGVQGPDDFSLAPSRGNIIAVIAKNSHNKLGVVKHGVYTDNDAVEGSVLLRPTG